MTTSSDNKSPGDASYRIQSGPAGHHSPWTSQASGLSLLFCLLALAMPLLYWAPAYDASGLPREMLLAVSAGVGLLLFSVPSLRTSLPLNWHAVHLWIFLLLCYATASLYWSVDKGSSLLAITQFASLLVLAMLASQISVVSVQRFILPAVLISAAVAALIGIAQHFGFNPTALRQLAPPASTFVNRNYAANYFDLITPVAFTLLLIQSRPTRPLALLASASFTACLGFLVVSQTRGSWLGLLVAVAALTIVCIRRPDFKTLFFDSLRRHHRALSIALLVALALGFTESRVITETGKLDAMLTLTPDTATAIRFTLYQNALLGFADRPWLGVGYGAFITGFSPYIAAVSPIEIVNQNNIMQFLHSDPLQMFFELGLPGGLLSIFIYLLVVVMAWRLVVSTAPPPRRLLALGLLLALLASGTHAWVDFPMRLPTSAFFFWLWCGIVIGLYLEIHPGHTSKLSRASLVIVGITGLLFSLHTAHLYFGYLRANTDVRSAHFHALKLDCDETFKLTKRAMNGFGIDHLTRFWYAKVYTYCDAPSNEKLRAMDRVLATTPNTPLAHLTRARIQLADGYLRGAASDFNQYRKLLPHRPEGYHGLGLIAIRVNNREQALYWLQKAVSQAPDNKELIQSLTQLNAGKTQDTGPDAD